MRRTTDKRQGWSTANRVACFAVLLVLLTGFTAPVLAQVKLDDTPRRYLSIRVDGAARDWDVRPNQIISGAGAVLGGCSEADLQTKSEVWARTGEPRRYLTTLWRKAFENWVGPTKAPDGSKFYFYAIDPRQPSAEGKLNVADQRKRLFWVPAQSVTIKAYPKTWVDVWESYVDQFEGEQRRQEVINWEKAHRDIIRNDQNAKTGFTQEERNEFARFYQAQFVFIRDKNPTLPSIYDELAAFHKERGNLDAELSTYLDALRSGVQSPDRERFHLAVGRIFVQRLQLYSDALPHLDAAKLNSEARYLAALCQFRLGMTGEARESLADLVKLVQTPPVEGALTLELKPEEELGRAYLLMAEVEFGLGNTTAAYEALEKIPQAGPHYAPGRLVVAAMLLYRNKPAGSGQPADAQKARDAIKVLPLWTAVQEFLAPKPTTAWPLSPEMARALVLYAQADGQYRDPASEGKKPSDELLSMLNAAKALDPLSSEPWRAEGRLYQHMGLFREALAAYMAGLDVNPGDVLLNYSAADLNFKAGVFSAAKDYFSRCLRYEPNFYPALSRLGEIAVLEIDNIRASLLIKQNAGEPVNYATELVPAMKEAAAFWTASLAIRPLQPATQLALATLYLQLAELAPLTMADSNEAGEVKRAYLTKARDLSYSQVQRAREYALASKVDSDARTDAEAPTLGAFNTWAFALYAMGDVEGARAAFEEHVASSKLPGFFASTTARTDYQTSAALAYAAEWLRRIDENNRRYFEVAEFDKDSTPEGYHGEWAISTNPKPDPGFSKATGIKGGKLLLAVDTKDKDFVVNRIEIEKPHATLAEFQAEFTKTGDAFMNRGIELTRCNTGANGAADPTATVMLGVDNEGRVYFETRRFRLNNSDKPEEQKDYGLVDVRSYGGLALNKDEPLTLAIRRQESGDFSEAEYVAVINGHEVKLAVTDSDLKLNDFKSGAAKLRCGFFTQAAAGAKGAVQVERAKFIYDSGLGGKSE